jgi:hypothetical protein
MGRVAKLGSLGERNKTMKIVESLPDKERRDLITAVINDAAAQLEVDPNNDTPESIVTRVDEAIVAMALGNPTPVAQDERPDLLLGCLWGAQMARQFNWYWANVVVNDSIDEVAMISPKQEMIIFPFSFVGACIQKQCICTVLLTFNMLLANKLGEIEPGAYEAIMLRICHIIPPYVL